jgi:hypothetical protein
MPAEEKIYRSGRTRSLLRYLHKNGPTCRFVGACVSLPSANVMRKLEAAGFIEVVQSYRIADMRRDLLTLELTITEKGRAWHCSVTGDAPAPLKLTE